MKIPFPSLLRYPIYRRIIGRIRMLWYIHLKKQLRTIDSPQAFPTTVKHNLKSLSHFGGVRMETIIRPLSVIESLSKESSICIIGPRNEADLLCLHGYGFAWNKIFGLDLITYSPQIQLGDMHQIPFLENTFDVVISGWTLSYSNQPEQVAKEFIRILKPGGIIAIGVEYTSMTPLDVKQSTGYFIDTPGFERINSTSQILSLFKNSYDHIYFNHDAPGKISHTSKGLVKRPSDVVAIFSIKK